MSAHVIPPLLLACCGWLFLGLGTAGSLATLVTIGRQSLKAAAAEMMFAGVSYGAAILMGVLLVRQSGGV